MTTEEVYEFIPEGYDRRFVIGQDPGGLEIEVLHYPEGHEIHEGHGWRLLHTCPRTNLNPEAETLRHPITMAKHDLHADEPLHLEPSVLCGSCGLHGFIREGRWVQA
jgi:hypothetical protein